MTVTMSKTERAALKVDYMERHGGAWDPAGFLEEVRAANGQHPAWHWFEWDRDTAAEKFLLEQAKEFGRGIYVTVKTEEIVHNEVKVVSVEVPLTLARTTKTGRYTGEHIQFDPSDEDHLIDMRRQARFRLAEFQRQFGAILGQDEIDHISAVALALA